MKVKTWKAVAVSALGLAVALALIWLLVPTKPAATLAVTFEADGVRLAFDRPVRLRQVAVFSETGQALLDLRLEGVRRSGLTAPLSWRPGRTYLFEVLTDQGRLTAKATAPRPAGPAQVRLTLPYAGRAAPDLAAPGPETGPAGPPARSLAAVGAAVTAGLLITGLEDAPAVFEAEISLPAGLEYLGPEEGPGLAVSRSAEGVRLRLSGRLAGRGDAVDFVFSLKASQKGRPGISAEVRVRAAGKTAVFRPSLELSIVDEKHLASAVEVLSVHLPAGRDGRSLSGLQDDSIYFQPPLFLRLAELLGAAREDLAFFAPLTYQSLLVRNRLDVRLDLAVTCRITYQDSPRTPPAFFPPNIATGGLKDIAAAVSLTLEPGQTSLAVLPLYVTSPPEPGQYRRLIQLRPAGLDFAGAELSLPLRVITLDWSSLYFTLLAGLLAAAGLVFLGFKFRALIKSLKIRSLVTIALYGALTFAAVNLPVQLFGAAVAAALGPFGLFLTGFFNDLVYFTFLISLVRLIPQPGVVALSEITRYLLAGLLAGGFQVFDFVFLGSAILTKEAALYLTGPTRRGAAFSWSWPATAVVALGLGLADAYLNATMLHLNVILFRLYYSGWYIHLSAWLNGLVYAGIGVALGRAFSRKLAWVEE